MRKIPNELRSQKRNASRSLPVIMMQILIQFKTTLESTQIHSLSLLAYLNLMFHSINIRFVAFTTTDNLMIQKI
jgi:hypothetical protein